MFGSGKIRELESQLTAMRGRLEKAEKEKKELDQLLQSTKDRVQILETQLEEAKNQILDRERQLAESEGTELKNQARKTIVEYEGLKELYVQKTREFDEAREAQEESFAKEAASKRHDLEEEIRTNREDNQTMVSDTVKTFAGSYQYYLDQVRVLMDALSQAAKETGESLFAGETGNIKEVFGNRILEHLKSDRDALARDTGNVLLIGTEDAKEKKEEETCAACGEEAAEAAVEEACGACEEAAEEVTEEAAEAVEAAAEEASGACEEAAEEVTEEATEAVAEEACGACEEAAEEATEEAAEAAEEVAEEACGVCGEAAEEVKEEATEAVEEMKEKAADLLQDEEA